MSKTFVLAHKRTVGSGADLAASLGIRSIVPGFRPRGGFGEEPTIINYGVGFLPAYSNDLSRRRASVINAPSAVAVAVNKKHALENLSRCVYVPEFTEDWRVAYRWLDRESSPTKTVFGRTKLCSSGGDGVVVFESQQALRDYVGTRSNPTIKLFTRGMPKNKEFRVHVVCGEVVDYSQKRRMGEEKLKELGLSEANRHVRNHDNGWVFCKVSAQIFPEIEQAAVSSVEALGLDFGAVDILAIVKDKKLVRYEVCEVNTAPSLSAPSTLQAYTDAFSSIIGKESFK